jgi:hypothetical protein
MGNSNRRRFLRNAGKLLTFTTLGSGVVATTANAGLKYEMSSTTEGKCATCRYWGGVRKLSKDSKTVISQSLGYCNNPESHNYHKTTTPETGPMKKWIKWEVIS